MAARDSGASDADGSDQTAPQIPHMQGAFPLNWWFPCAGQCPRIVAFAMAPTRPGYSSTALNQVLPGQLDRAYSIRDHHPDFSLP